MRMHSPVSPLYPYRCRGTRSRGILLDLALTKPSTVPFHHILNSVKSLATPFSLSLFLPQFLSRRNPLFSTFLNLAPPGTLLYNIYKYMCVYFFPLRFLFESLWLPSVSLFYLLVRQLWDRWRESALPSLQPHFSGIHRLGGTHGFGKYPQHIS